LNATQQYFYTILVQNLGPAGSTNVVVTDDVPSAFYINEPITTTKGTCSNVGNLVTCNLGTLLCPCPTVAVQIIIPVKVSLLAVPGDATNTAILTVQNNANNNTNGTVETI